MKPVSVPKIIKIIIPIIILKTPIFAEKVIITRHFKFIYRYDLEKQEECGVVAHERLTEPRVTME